MPPKAASGRGEQGWCGPRRVSTPSSSPARQTRQAGGGRAEKVSFPAAHSIVPPLGGPGAPRSACNSRLKAELRTGRASIPDFKRVVVLLHLGQLAAQVLKRLLQLAIDERI